MPVCAPVVLAGIRVGEMTHKFFGQLPIDKLVKLTYRLPSSQGLSSLKGAINQMSRYRGHWPGSKLRAGHFESRSVTQ